MQVDQSIIIITGLLQFNIDKGVCRPYSGQWTIPFSNINTNINGQVICLCADYTAVIALLSPLHGLVVTWPGRALTFLITPIGNDGYIQCKPGY